jgi:hypothetical protein
MLMPVDSPIEAAAASSCGCQGHKQGGSGRGLGIFDSMDPTTWGLGEWSLIGAGLFLAFGGAAMFRGGNRGGGARRKKLQALKAQYDLARAEA